MTLHFTRKKTKVVCTLGPSTDNPNILEKMLKTGMDVARLNFSHGSHIEHARRIRLVRQAAKKTGKVIAVLQDLPGPKIRLGKLIKSQINLKSGQKVCFTSRPPFSDIRLRLDSPLLAKAIKLGENIYLADGVIRLVVLRARDKEILAEVQNDGVIRSGSGMNLPNTNLFGSGFYQSDKPHILLGLKQSVDWIALSFVGSAENIKVVRKICERYRKGVKLLAKIERQLALQNLDEILAEADGVMVARGDLGIEIPLSQVPLVQKEIIARCNKASKPVIVATQMLESMVNNPRPTRAEVTDVANAVLDGADAVMLSAETAVGKFPVQAVEMLNQISLETERVFPYESYLERAWPSTKLETSFAIGHAACSTARSVGAKAIVVPTRSGRTALRVAEFRPAQPIVALTRTDLVQRQLALVWNVFPVRNRVWHSLPAVTRVCKQVVIDLGLGKPGDKLVMTSGFPIEAPGGTNLIQVVSL
jgi:pyruvate kinase